MLFGKKLPEVQDPKAGKPTPEGIHDFRDPSQPTLTTMGWVVAAILLPLPAITLWVLHRVDKWPTPCLYFAVWVVAAIVVGFLAGALA